MSPDPSASGPRPAGPTSGSAGSSARFPSARSSATSGRAAAGTAEGPSPAAQFKGSLKDLFSPAQIQHLMRVEFDRARRHKYPIVMLLIAVDRVEQLQDLYGSELKSRIDEALVGLLKGATRASDSIGCLLDDRVLVLVPHTPPEGASTIAKRVLEGMRAMTFDCDGRPTRITVSIGGAHSSRDGDLAFETMIEVSEGGLRVARDGGGNRYVHSDLYEFFERKRAREAQAGSLTIAPPLRSVAALPAGASGAAPLLGDKIREMFGSEGVDPDLLARIEQQVIASALREMKGELERVLTDSRSEQQRQIAMLERRIAKLSDALGMTEAELQRVLQQGTLDPGVASIYKTVQGLSARDVQAELKKALMSKIFEANVELRKQISDQSRP
jgi:diguanylate cyclase (GGDEF)-like protein